MLAQILLYHDPKLVSTILITSEVGTRLMEIMLMPCVYAVCVKFCLELLHVVHNQRQ
jgi:hypothetical protein